MPTMTPDHTRTVEFNGGKLTINEKIIPNDLLAIKDVASWCLKGQHMKPCAKLFNGTGKPQGLTIHNSEEVKCSVGINNMAEQYVLATFNQNMGGVVVTFYVHLTNVWQTLDETERGWHAKDGSTRRDNHTKTAKIGGNLDTISIEVIGNDPITVKTAQQLCGYLCSKYNLDPSKDIYTHNYFMYKVDTMVKGASKNCPYYILPNWGKFLKEIPQYCFNSNSSENDPSKSNNEVEDTQTPKLYRVQCGAFTESKNALNLKSTLQGQGYTSIIVNTGKMYKVQCGAFKLKTNAENLKKSLDSLFAKLGLKISTFITTADNTMVQTTANNTVVDINKMIAVGSTVKVVRGARTSSGQSLKSFVYDLEYIVTSLSKGVANISPVTNLEVTTAKMKVEDLILISKEEK